MICGKCKGKVEEGAKFCPHCGAKFKLKAPDPEVKAQTPPPPQAEADAPPPIREVPVSEAPMLVPDAATADEKPAPAPKGKKKAAQQQAEQPAEVAPAEEAAVDIAAGSMDPTPETQPVPKAEKQPNKIVAFLSSLLRPASYALTVIGICALLLAVLASNVSLLKSGTEILGVLKAAKAGGAIGLVAAVLGGAAAVFDLVLGLGKPDTLRQMITSILIAVSSAAVALTALVALVY